MATNSGGRRVDPLLAVTVALFVLAGLTLLVISGIAYLVNPEVRAWVSQVVDRVGPLVAVAGALGALAVAGVLLLLWGVWAAVRQRVWRLGYNLWRVLGWAARHWELTVAVILLFLVTVGAYAYARTFWAVMLVLGLVVAIVVLARYEHVTMVFSGEVGEFSDPPYHRWSRSVACEHYPDWPRMPPAKWIWIRDKPTNEEALAGQEVTHLREFWLLRDPETVRLAKLRLRVDDEAHVCLNSEPLGDFRGYGELHEVDIANYLKRGKNELCMRILNDAISESTGDSNPSGVVYDVKIE